MIKFLEIISSGIQNVSALSYGGREGPVVQCHSLTFIPKSTYAAAEDDFYDVYCELENSKARYYQLGRVLRLPLGKLEAIRKTHSQYVEQALTQVLLLWLRQQYNVEKFGRPTWQKLREAVDSPSGGENHALAERIAKKYLTSSMSRHSNFCTTLFLVIFIFFSLSLFPPLFSLSFLLSSLLPPFLPLFHGSLFSALV